MFFWQVISRFIAKFKQLLKHLLTDGNRLIREINTY